MRSTCQVVLLTSVVQIVQAAKFLELQPESVPTAEIEFLLLSENSSSQKLDAFETELRPLFVSMPKNAVGRLDPPVVRYTLHRYFAEKFGWHFKGLDPNGGAWNSSSTTAVMKDKVPSYIEELFQQKLQGKGLTLRDLATFASALTDLVNKEAEDSIYELYDVWQWDRTDLLRPFIAKSILKAYLMLSVEGIHRKGTTQQQYRELEQELRQLCFAWPDAQVWLEDTRLGVEFLQQAHHNPFVVGMSHNQMIEVVHELAHQFGKFQNLECASMKERLVDMEDAGTGRVPLNKFYSGVADPLWPFYESQKYLRSLGALDETNPRTPSVIIPNYLASSTYCTDPSNFYSVCCIDECESLLAHVERAVKQPVALPSELAEVVSKLESDTVSAPRNLSSLQHKRLDQIATLHGGRVPLHGRLFAQWMHHAYPRECKFPHVSGTTQPLSQHEFTQTVAEFEASDEEMYSHVRREDYAVAAARTDDDKIEELPWSLTEELVSPHISEDASEKSCVRMVLLLVAFISATLPAARASKFFSSKSAQCELKHFV